jgi:pseudaminic acid cytidylyltransferase
VSVSYRQSFAVIPARGGSRRIPKKNIREFHGRPIIAYSIQAAQESGLFHRIVVNTDDGGIAWVARQYGAEVLFRPSEFGHDNIGTQEVINLTCRLLCFEEDFVCTIYPCAPLMTPQDLIQGQERFLKQKKPWLYTVGPDNQDAGQWYMGRAKSYMAGIPLDNASHFKLPAERTCDINTENDWQKALMLFNVEEV